MMTLFLYALLKYIPNFEVRIGGTTSIDVTKKGINKAYGIKKITKYLNIKKEAMLFVGDSVFPGGNDYSVKEAGVETIGVSGHENREEFWRVLKRVPTIVIGNKKFNAKEGDEFYVKKESNIALARKIQKYKYLKYLLGNLIKMI